MKPFQGTCVDNPFGDIDTLCQVVENACKITKRTFLKHCDVHPELIRQFNQWPRDYAFSKCQNVYFYTWSCIEHFYYFN